MESAHIQYTDLHLAVPPSVAVVFGFWGHKLKKLLRNSLGIRFWNQPVLLSTLVNAGFVFYGGTTMF